MAYYYYTPQVAVHIVSSDPTIECSIEYIHVMTFLEDALFEQKTSTIHHISKLKNFDKNILDIIAQFCIRDVKEIITEKKKKKKKKCIIL